MWSTKHFGRHILQSTWGNFTKFTTYVHLGTKMNWLHFKVKGQDYDEIRYGQKSLVQESTFQTKVGSWWFAVEDHLFLYAVEWYHTELIFWLVSLTRYWLSVNLLYIIAIFMWFIVIDLQVSCTYHGLLMIGNGKRGVRRRSWNQTCYCLLCCLHFKQLSS